MNTRALRALPSHSRGFTLVELMVAATIGMLVALALTSAVVTTGRQYAMISANVAAQNSAQIGLSLIDRSARSAGAGFFAGGDPICPTWNAYIPANGTVPARTIDGETFMPVKITDGGGAGLSDTIVFTGGSGSVPFALAPVLDTMSGNSVYVTNAGLANNDVAVRGAPGSGKPCTLFAVNGSPGSGTGSNCGNNAATCAKLNLNGGTGTLNGGTFTTAPTLGFTASGTVSAPAVVSRVGTGGSFRQDAFRVECSSLVRYNAFVGAPPAACTSNPLAFASGVDAIATDVVLMQAQYGISASGASDVVTDWVDASGAWAAPAATDVARIKAIRVVLVARSKEPDGSLVTAANCTNPNGVSNTGPCSFQDAQAPAIDLSGVPVPSGRNWRNYRYRVHMAVMPLRAVIWSN